MLGTHAVISHSITQPFIQSLRVCVNEMYVQKCGHWGGGPRDWQTGRKQVDAGDAVGQKGRQMWVEPDGVFLKEADRSDWKCSGEGVCI